MTSAGKKDKTWGWGQGEVTGHPDEGHLGRVAGPSGILPTPVTTSQGRFWDRPRNPVPGGGGIFSEGARPAGVVSPKQSAAQEASYMFGLQ